MSKSFIPSFLATYRIEVLWFLEDRPALEGNITAITDHNIVIEVGHPSHAYDFVKALPGHAHDPDYVQSVSLLAVEHNVDGFACHLPPERQR